MNEPVHTGAPARRGRPPNKAAPGETGRTNDPARTMAEILEVATQEFASKGLSGARIDEIAAATRTSKRMIYYYFGSKEGLYLKVLEDAGLVRSEYGGINVLDLEGLRRFGE